MSCSDLHISWIFEYFGFLPNIWCPVLWCTYHAYNIWITGVMLCTVHILNGITPRSTLEVGEPRPMDKLSCPLWNLAFAFVFLSYFLLPCCLSSVIFSTTSIFSTKHCSPGLQELLMPDHLFFSHWCHQASKDPGSAQSWRERRAGGGRQRHRQRQRRRQHRPLAAPGSLGVLSPSEWQCGPQVWRPSWAMVAVPPPPWAPPAACSRGCSRATLAHQTIPTTP